MATPWFPSGPRRPLTDFPLLKFPGVTPTFQSQIFERTQKSGAEVISRKGGAGYAVGVAIREVIDSIALDRRRVLPVSSHVKGAYGIRDVSISVPTVVGRGGRVEAHRDRALAQGIAGPAGQRQSAERDPRQDQVK